MMSFQWANEQKTMVFSTLDTDTVYIPADPDNADYAALLAAGTVIADYEPPTSAIKATKPAS